MITKREYLKGLDMNNNKIMASLSAVTAEFEGTFAEDFTGAGLSTAGLSGLVPAPQAGDNDKFLCGDGSWVVPSFVLSTVPATVDGVLWYEVTDNIPALWVRYGHYEYSYSHDKIRFVGTVDDALVAYLPFEVSTTFDVCGNEWTAGGNPTIVDGALYLDGSSYLTNSTISNSIGEQPWTIDFWATATSSSTLNGFFGTVNALNNITGQWISVSWNSGNPMINFYYNDHVVNLNLQLNTRHHYALTYDGTNVYFFVDGVLGKTLTLPVQLGGDFVIGARPFKDSAFNGTIDHFRILTGALWTENFTPPTATDYL